MDSIENHSRSDEQVGYKKPPKSKRFQKGHSGNPYGRPPAQENIIAVFKRLALQKLKVRERDKARWMTRLEAIILANMQAALRGDPTAMSNLMRLAELQGEFRDLADPTVVGKPIMLPEPADMEEFEWLGRYLGPGQDYNDLYNALEAGEPLPDPPI